MRNYNIDREPISSEEVSTFKDFKSILRKHAQTTEDLAKIKPSSNNSIIYWAVGIVVVVAAATSLVLNSSYNSSNTKLADELIEKPSVNEVTEEKKSKLIKPFVNKNRIEWTTIIKKPQESIEGLINVNRLSASRIEYAKLKSSKDAEELLSGIQKSDADFVIESIVFKIDNKESIEVSNKNEVHKLGQDGKWVKVDFEPVSMPFIEKPNLYTPGESGLKVNFKEFKGPASEYRNVFWKPVDAKDYDEVDQIIANGLDDIKIRNADINGVYNLTFISGDLTVRINAYPCLLKDDFDEAMKEYDIKLQKAQQAIMSAQKEYILTKGIYTVK